MRAQSSWRDLVLHPAVPALLTDVALLGYAAFTLVSQLTALAGGSPRVLLPALLAIAAGMSALLALVATRKPAWAQAYVAEQSAVPVTAGLVPPARRETVIAGSLLAMVVCVLVVGPSVGWIPCAFAAGWLALQALRLAPGSEPAAPDPAEPRWALAVVYLCGLIGAALALLVVRPRSDDAFYLNMALSVFDRADLPLLSVNSIHGPPNEWLGPQRMFAPYRVHSFEVLGGTLSQLTGIDPAVMLHLVLGPLLSFLAPFAIARALRQLTAAWWVGVAAVVAFLCIEGTASVGYANHAFVRMFHGKSVLLTAGLPLLIVHGLRFGQAPGRMRFAFLVAAQIAAVGLSSTAIWLGPIVAVVAVWAGTPARGLLLRRTPLAVLSCVYVLALGLWVFGQLRVADDEASKRETAAQQRAQAEQRAAVSQGKAEPAQAAVPADRADPAGAADKAEKPVVEEPDVASESVEARVESAIETALGPGRTALGLLALFGLALALVRSPVAFRLLSWLSLCAVLLAAPFALEWIARFITGNSTYHRLFWLLPIPLAFGIAVAELWLRARSRLQPLPAAAFACGAAIVLLALCTQRLVVSEANHVRLVYPPALKIGPKARRAARAVCEHVSQGEYVLASSSVSEQVAAIRECGHPLLTVTRWMSAPQQELRERAELASYVGTGPDVPLARAQWFVEKLARYRPKAVVTLGEAMKNRRMKLLLRWAGYDKMEQVEGIHIWLRLSKVRKAEYERIALDVCQKVPRGAIVLAPFNVSRELASNGCATPLYRVQERYDAAVDANAQLERVLSTPGELTGDDATQFRAMLLRERIGAIVLAPLGMGNAQLRTLLRDLAFQNLRGKGGYRVFVAAAAAP